MGGKGVWLEERMGRKLVRPSCFLSAPTGTSSPQIGKKLRVEIKSKSSLKFWTKLPLHFEKKLN